jgi:hypothetical protein
MEMITFGNSRKIILDTIIALKRGELDVSRGMAIAANMKVLNDNIQIEINAAKLSLRASESGRDFGEVVKLGRRLLIEEGVEFVDDASLPRKRVKTKR